MRTPTAFFAIAVLAVSALLAGCSSTPISPTPSAPSKAGKYYSTDGPLKGVSEEAVAAIPEPVPKREPLRKSNMRPYTALGKAYYPMTKLAPYREQGIGSWYGTLYHGKKTASGEPYDMLSLTAAHPTLPLPSYVRVTNLENKRSLVVRVNDRGPFLHGRIIDLSYAAAIRLGYANKGSAPVEVELIIPD